MLCYGVLYAAQSHPAAQRIPSCREREPKANNSDPLSQKGNRNPVSNPSMCAQSFSSQLRVKRLRLRLLSHTMRPQQQRAVNKPTQTVCLSAHKGSRPLFPLCTIANNEESKKGHAAGSRGWRCSWCCCGG